MSKKDERTIFTRKSPDGSTETTSITKNGGAVQISSTVVTNLEQIQLIDACRTGNLVLAKDAVAKGADTRANDDYALRAAIVFGHLEIMKYLIAKGADINKCRDFAMKFVKYGNKDIGDFLHLLSKTDKLSKMLVEEMLKDASE